MAPPIFDGFNLLRKMLTILTTGSLRSLQVKQRQTDPQQQMLLKVIYVAVSSAGLTLEALDRSDTVIYVGIIRASYFFNWNGLSMAIDTACSSSLVAFMKLHHRLCGAENQELQLLLGPIFRCLSSLTYLTENNLSVRSPEERCGMWDKAAGGYARDDDVAAIVLKTLGAVIQDGDHVECVIRDKGVNLDGKLWASLYQTQLFKPALFAK
ncbi:hypothetical protein McaMca56_001965 [Microsporum canis]